MAYPPLVDYPTEQEYFKHYVKVYCCKPISTFDGIAVRFRRDQFYHCFFESVHSKDDTFSIARAERIDWIMAVLQDQHAELRVGWDNQSKQPALNRRVAIVSGDYVVVIRLHGANKAAFVTAFVAGDKTIRQIRTNPLWK